jgi:diguanylate cyclase (GGDEF)-like protein
LCSDIEEYSGALSSHERDAASPRSSFVGLPLLAAGIPLGVLMIGVAKGAHFSEQELMLLEELADQLSSALQTLPEEHTVQTLAPLDPLTGLPRREFFCQHLEHFLATRTEEMTVPTVAVFDIEHLGDVNDAYGRHVGDRLLQCIAERLKHRFGGSADLAYFGAGTFAVVFSECRASRADGDPATALFGHPFSISDRAVPVTVKCGLAHFGSPARDADTLLQHAEAALARIRDRKNPKTQSLRRGFAADSSTTAIEQRLRHALKHDEFVLQYQPLVDALSGRVVAVEALLRWQDLDRGMIPPGVFLPVLEQGGLIIAVGEWIVTRAARDCAHWQRGGSPPLRVAVNVSPSELAGKQFAAHFLSTVRREHAPMGIDIEITESALIHDVESVRTELKILRNAGVGVAIDDFGMGYSSLTRLCELPVDALKIDRSFISRLTYEPQSQAVVATIIALARAYSLRTVAEGVETREQLLIVNALGCDLSQGYLHSPPISAEEVALLMTARATSVPVDSSLALAVAHGTRLS